ncbi:metallophosphoesterase [Porphyromonadaceae bacterium W3.11]|nr:metallophosphoesterase [Porphyromonadaceae bacterium W3.11]
MKVKAVIASDLHLMSNELVIENGSSFQKVLDADRKLLVESEVILDHFLNEVRSIKPDLLLLPGDLSKDGERINHILLSKKLDQLREDVGTLSFVVPGNHDINNPHSRYYVGDHYTTAERTSPDEFKKIYAHHGYAGTNLIEQGPDLCYVSEPFNGIWILGIDSCIYDNNLEENYPHTGGAISEERLKWIEKIMKRAISEGKQVLTMMHHGILEHFPMQSYLAREYLVDNWPLTAHRLSNAGIKTIFTGHFHAQDIVSLRFSKGLLYDIETGSIVTYPCPYRVIEVYDDRLEIKSNMIQLQGPITNGMTLEEFSYNHIRDGIPGLANFLIGYIQKRYPGNLNDTQAMMIKELVPQFTPLIMDIYAGHLSGDETGLTYSEDNSENSESTPSSGDLMIQLKQLIDMTAPKYSPLLSTIEGALHSSSLPDNDLVIWLD